MPQIIIGGALLYMVFKAGDGALESASRLAMWGAIGGGVWVAGKALKVI